MERNLIHKNTLEWLDCQVELIIKSLELYLYTSNLISKQNAKSDSENKEKELNNSILRDTYNQILNECKDGINVKANDTYYKLIGKIA